MPFRDRTVGPAEFNSNIAVIRRRQVAYFQGKTAFGIRNRGRGG